MYWLADNLIIIVPIKLFIYLLYMVHEKTLAEYKKHNFIYDFKPHDIQLANFNEWLKLSGRPPHIVVNKITRIKTPKDENGRSEFIVYSEKRIGHDHVGNEKTFTEDKMGEYDVPVFRNEWDEATNTIKAKQVESHRKVYEIPYDPKEIDKLQAKADIVNIQYYVQFGSKRFSIINYEDFRDGDIDDLIQLGKSTKTNLAELFPEKYGKKTINEKVEKNKGA